GHLSAGAGVIDAPIGRDQRDPTRRAVVTTGRAARTHFEVLRRLVAPDTSFVRCSLETGRTHQIRVHLTSVGHPVVGDSTYGRKGEVRLTTDRPFLHAAVLSFEHPRTGSAVRATSPLPTDLQRVLD